MKIVSILGIKSISPALHAVLTALMVSCAAPPARVVHVKPPPEVAALLRHPALRITDPQSGNWVRGLPRTARQAWSGEGWAEPALGAAGAQEAAPVAVAGLVASFLLVNTIYSLVSPSADQIAEARRNILHAVQSGGWQAAFHEGFVAEARRHGVASVERLTSSGPLDRDGVVDVVVREASVGTSHHRPQFDLDWGVHRSGRSPSLWWGKQEINCPERKSFMEWGANGGEPLAKALREMFRDAGRKLAVELYEGSDVKL